MNAPESWGESKEETTGEDVSNNQQSSMDRLEESKDQIEEEREEQQDQDGNQDTAGIPDGESYEGNVPFGRIF